jgi:hypothetical protein
MQRNKNVSTTQDETNWAGFYLQFCGQNHFKCIFFAMGFCYGNANVVWSEQRITIISQRFYALQEGNNV